MPICAKGDDIRTGIKASAYQGWLWAAQEAMS